MRNRREVEELFRTRKPSEEAAAASRGFHHLGAQIASWYREVQAGHRALALIVRRGREEDGHET